MFRTARKETTENNTAWQLLNSFSCLSHPVYIDFMMLVFRLSNLILIHIDYAVGLQSSFPSGDLSGLVAYLSFFETAWPVEVYVNKQFGEYA